MNIELEGYTVKAVWNSGHQGWDIQLPGRRMIVSGRGLSAGCGKGKLKAALKAIPSFSVAQTYEDFKRRSVIERAEDWLANNWTAPVHIGNLSCLVCDLEDRAAMAYAIREVTSG